ncbi:MAG TPA: ubiquinol-cytochrome C chaperone family protein, partial [Aestuariivirga sp.]|nr:ubiquinol-cytochrome C chaperone family protein [Aestuariivirga sp.]
MNLWPWPKPSPKPEDRLYAAIVAATRRPRFYAEWGVPDTFDGRFDMLVAHLYLVVERLKDEGQDELGRALIERFITDMDDVLRELGTSDVTVGKKVRKMAEAFHGRAAAYDRADADET